MHVPHCLIRLRPDPRIIVAALVPAKGDEDTPSIAAAIADLEASGIVVVDTVIQRRGVSRARKPGGSRKIGFPMNATTYIGRGKAIELAERVAQQQADAVVFCNPLSGTQKRNIERIVGVPVVAYDSNPHRCRPKSP